MAEVKPGQTTTVSEVDFVALPAGEKIGRYEIVAVLGQGGFGITYRARDTQLEPRRRDQGIPADARWPLREGRTTVLPRSTEHGRAISPGAASASSTKARRWRGSDQAPGIVRVYDFLEANGTAYMVMALLEGETLEHAPEARAAAARRPRSSASSIRCSTGWSRCSRRLPASRHQAGQYPARRQGPPTLIDFGASRAAMPDRTDGDDGDLHAGLCRRRAVHLGQAGPVDRHLRRSAATLYHAITGTTAAQRHRAHARRRLRAAGELRPRRLRAGAAGRHRCRPGGARRPTGRSRSPSGAQILRMARGRPMP